MVVRNNEVRHPTGVEDAYHIISVAKEHFDREPLQIVSNFDPHSSAYPRVGAVKIVAPSPRKLSRR